VLIDESGLQKGVAVTILTAYSPDPRKEWDGNTPISAKLGFHIKI